MHSFLFMNRVAFSIVALGIVGAGGAGLILRPGLDGVPSRGLGASLDECGPVGVTGGMASHSHHAEPADHGNGAPRISDDPVRRELVIEVGPVDLPAGPGGDAQPAESAQGDRHGGPEPGPAAHTGEGGHEDHEGVFPPIGTVCVPFAASIYGFSFELLDKDGRQLPPDLLHHFNVIDPDYRDLFLPISRRVLGLSRETGAQSVPGFLMGIPLEAGQRLVVVSMLHNPTGTPYRNVQVRVRLKYVKRGRPWPLVPVYNFQLDVGFPAGDKSFDLPPGRSSRTFEGSPAIPGHILGIGGHVHDYAVSVQLEDATTGKLIWQAQPITDDWGRVVGMPVGRLYRKLGVLLQPDHRYRVSVEYHNPTADTIRNGGMGLVGGVFAPLRGVPWPAVDTTDALYRLDRLHYLRLLRGRFEEIRAR